jgi:hypothetical protein
LDFYICVYKPCQKSAYIKDEVETPQVPTTRSFSCDCKLTLRWNRSNENLHLKFLSKVVKVFNNQLHISPYSLPNPQKERYPNNNALVQTFLQPNPNELLVGSATWIS